MARHKTHRQLAHLINWRRGANNAQIPQSWIFRRAATAMNQFALYQPKCFISRAESLLATPGWASGSDVDRVIWYACGRTGVATTKVRNIIGLARAGEDMVVGDNSRVFVVYSDLSNATVTGAISDSISYGQIAPAALVPPGEILWGTIDIEVEADSIYSFTLESRNCARPVAWTCMEYPGAKSVSDGINGASSPAPYINGGPIYTQHIQDLLEQCTYLLKKNGPHLLSWSARSTNAAPLATTRTAGTYAQHSASDEHIVPVRYHHRRSQTVVPVELAVLAQTTAGSTNGVRIVDADSGAQLIEATGFTTTSGADWLTFAGSIPATTRAVRIETKSDGAATLSVWGVALWEYEA